MKQLLNKLFKIFVGLTVFLIPWQTRWIFFDRTLSGGVWEYGRVSLYASMLILLLAAVLFYWQNRKKINLKNLFDSHESKWLILTIFYFWTISLFSPIPQVTIYILALLILAILFYYLSKKTSPGLIYGSLLASGVLQGLLAIWQTAQQKVIGNKWLGMAEHLSATLGTSVVEYDISRILRAYGSLPHPNILGGFLVLASLAGLWWWLHIYQQASKDNWSGPKIKKCLIKLFLVVTALIIIVVGLLLTFSRGALLALLIAIIISLFIALWKQRWLKVQVIFKFLIIIVLMFYAGQFLFPGSWSARLQINQRLEIQSVTQRISGWQQIDWQNPQQLLLGQGLGMNTYVNLETGQPAYNVQPIHNIFLLALAEIGIIGVLLLLNLLCLFRHKKIGGWWSTWLLAFIILGLFDHYFWTSWTGWMMMAIIFASFSKKRNEI